MQQAFTFRISTYLVCNILCYLCNINNQAAVFLCEFHHISGVSKMTLSVLALSGTTEKLNWQLVLIDCSPSTRKNCWQKKEFRMKNNAFSMIFKVFFLISVKILLSKINRNVRDWLSPNFISNINKWI